MQFVKLKILDYNKVLINKSWSYFAKYYYTIYIFLRINIFIYFIKF